jgi:hypothetical protein
MKPFGFQAAKGDGQEKEEEYEGGAQAPYPKRVKYSINEPGRREGRGPA